MTSGTMYAYTKEQAFFGRMALFLSLFIAFAFAQFALRGIPDYQTAPPWVHLHGMIFLAWLILYVVQNRLAANGSLALHRKLGWLGALLAILMVVAGSFTSLKTIELHRIPPHFDPPYFLPLTHVSLLAFGGLVAAGIGMRRQTEWHRRLILSATVILLDPALDRILPGPLIGGEASQAIILVLQLAVLGIAMRHDRQALGRVHPALWWGAGILIASHALVSLLARTPAVAAFANGIAGA